MTPEPICRCGHPRDDHGSRTEQRGGEKVYVQKCEHCVCEVFTDKDGPLGAAFTPPEPCGQCAHLIKTVERLEADLRLADDLIGLLKQRA